MTAALHPAPVAVGVSFIETNPGYWTVNVGEDSRSITQVGSSFIAWVGCQSKHWCFSKALTACVEDIEYRRFEHERAQAEHDEAIAALIRMTPAEKSRLIDKLTAERDWLDFSDSEVDVVARKAKFDRQISTLREIS